MPGPFLTDLDSRAAVKGSRDPLGLQSVWTHFGRQVVGNLTVASSSLRDFIEALVGYYFVDRLRDLGSNDDDVSIFLRWEQLASYARAHVNKDWVFRGTERVRRNLGESNRVTLSADRAYQTLASQKMYGLWGLYTVPSRSSGLIDRLPARPAATAVELIERVYLPILAREHFPDGKAICDLLGEPRTTVDVDGRHAGLLRAVAKVLHHDLLEVERHFYRDHLQYGGPHDPTSGAQREIAELLQGAFGKSGFDISRNAMDRLARQASPQTAARLRDICTCESLLAPASMLFSFLQSCGGKPITAVAKAVREQWGGAVPGIDPEEVQRIAGEISVAAGKDAGPRFAKLAYALKSGSYADAIEILVDQNRVVMAERGAGAAWIEREGERLRVRISDDRGQLPTRDELKQLWRFPYFLPSLASVSSALSGAKT